MNNCSLCKWWHRHYPDDMGVCTVRGGPGNGTGFMVPVRQAVISPEMRRCYAHLPLSATSCDSICDKFENMRTHGMPDGPSGAERRNSDTGTQHRSVTE